MVSDDVEHPELRPLPMKHPAPSSGLKTFPDTPIPTETLDLTPIASPNTPSPPPLPFEEEGEPVANRVINDIISNSLHSNSSRNRSGSLSQYLESRESATRRSIYIDSQANEIHQSILANEFSLTDLLALSNETILEGLEDSEGILCEWLRRREHIETVLTQFAQPVCIPPPPPLCSPPPPPVAAAPRSSPSSVTPLTELEEELQTTEELPQHEEEEEEEVVDPQYGYYRNCFILCEIIIRVYGYEENSDLFDCLSSVSSEADDASSQHSTGKANDQFVGRIFKGESENDDGFPIWKLFFRYFQATELDPIQAVFACKVLFHLHEICCMDDEYPAKVLAVYFPLVLQHAYIDSVCDVIVRIFQSYEKVYQKEVILKAMDVLIPLVCHSSCVLEPISLKDFQRIDNLDFFFVKVFQGNRADQQGHFLRFENGLLLAKHFVRDQFGNIRGMEAVRNGYHNFLQFLFLQQFGKTPKLLQQLFAASVRELREFANVKSRHIPTGSKLDVLGELLNVCVSNRKQMEKSIESNEQEQSNCSNNAGNYLSNTFNFLMKKASSPLDKKITVDSNLDSGKINKIDEKQEGETLDEDDDDDDDDDYDDGDEGSSNRVVSEVAYDLETLSDGEVCWRQLFEMTLRYSSEFVSFADNNQKLPGLIQVLLMKLLYSIIQLNNLQIDRKLAEEKVFLPMILRTLSDSKSSDQLLIAVSCIIIHLLNDPQQLRPKESPLIQQLFPTPDNSKKKCASTFIDLLVQSFQSRPNHQFAYMQLFRDAMKNIYYSPLSCQTFGQQYVVTALKQHPLWSYIEHDILNDISRKEIKHKDDEIDIEIGIEEKKEVISAQDQKENELIEQEDAFLVQQQERNKEDIGEGEEKKNVIVRKEKQVKKRSSFFNPFTKEENSSSRSGVRTSILNSFHINSNSSSSSSRIDSLITKFKGMRRKSGTFFTGEHSQANQESKKASYNHQVLVLDTSLGDDVTKSVHHDCGVVEEEKEDIVKGYVFSNSLPRTGQRHRWERLYFYLANRTLKMYASESDAIHSASQLKAVVRPTSVSEGIPLAVVGQKKVYGFQFNTQGHGFFHVVVKSSDARLVWLHHLLNCITGTIFSPKSATEILFRENVEGSQSSSSRSIKEVVSEFYDLIGSQQQQPFLISRVDVSSYIASDFVLSSNLPSDMGLIPHWGEFHGLSGWADYWRIREETTELLNGGRRILKLLADPADSETVIVLTSCEIRILSNGRTVTEEACEIVTVHPTSGLISAIHSNFNSAHIVQAFTADGCNAS